MKSSLKLTSSTHLGKQQLAKIKTIWQSLQDHNDSVQFRNPVNYKQMGLYDYPQYIKYPMDLSTINRKLRQTRYRYVQEILDDFQLIWDNCKLYNPTNSWIHNLADRLDKAFKRMVKEYLPNILIPSIAKGKQTKSQIKTQNQFPQQEISHTQKLQFCQKLKMLSSPSLLTLTQTLKTICPKAFVDQDQKAQILIDYLDKKSFETALKVQQLLIVDKASGKRVKLI